MVSGCLGAPGGLWKSVEVSEDSGLLGGVCGIIFGKTKRSSRDSYVMTDQGISVKLFEFEKFHMSNAVSQEKSASGFFRQGFRRPRQLILRAYFAMPPAENIYEKNTSI